MTLLEMSVQYAEAAAALRLRIAELRAAERAAPDALSARALKARIHALLPLLQEARELAALTAHYYDRGGHRHEQDAS